MHLARVVCGVVMLLALGSSAVADAVTRLQPERLRATHEKIEALKTQRQEVKLASGYDDVRVLLHVHSHFSHDSRGTIEEIVAAAKEAGVRVILFSEHPASTYDYVEDGHRGEVDGVLLIPGAETSGFLAYPKQSVQDQKPDSPQAYCDLVRATDGMVFLCHLEERMDWEIDDLTGSEIYNTHADVKDEPRFMASLRNPVTMLTLLGAIKQYPQEVFGALLDYPADYLARYDELCQTTRLTGVSANDAHHNQGFRATVTEGGKVLLEDALDKKLAELDPDKITPLKLLVSGKQPGDVIFELDLDPYVRSFRHVSTHLLLDEVNEQSVREALKQGRAYVAFDWLADPTGFVFRADRGDKNWPIGSEVPLADGLRLRAEAPLEAQFKLVRNGEIVAEHEARTIDIPIDTPGVYRVEAWLTLAGEGRPWILSNPIYVRGQ
ncbi:MAG: PHP domain-containing protein [Planctomycetota bacterium]|nr:MAG: PHP domain-containing protein [Planctomycetota bacterium]